MFKLLKLKQILTLDFDWHNEIHQDFCTIPFLELEPIGNSYENQWLEELLLSGRVTIPKQSDQHRTWKSFVLVEMTCPFLLCFGWAPKHFPYQMTRTTKVGVVEHQPVFQKVYSQLPTFFWLQAPELGSIEPVRLAPQAGNFWRGWHSLCTGCW